MVVRDLSQPPIEPSKMNSMRQRIALISCTGHDWISNPVLNTAEYLGRTGWEVDVYGCVTGRMPSPSLAVEQVRYHAFSRADRAGWLPTMRGMSRWLTQHFAGRRYQCVIGYDPDGLLLAAIQAQRYHLPYWYYSLELFVPPSLRRWKAWLRKQAEVIASRRAQRIITQDPLRAEWFIRHHGVSQQKIIVVPNTPLQPPEVRREAWLHQMLSLPEGCRVVLNIGSLIREHMAVALAESALEWPAGFILVMHGWFAREAEKTRCEQIARARPDRLRLSTQSLPPAQKDLVYHSADFGLVFYEPVNDNLRFVGAASGKLFEFMRCGVPVIASRLPGMQRLIEEPGWGILVDRVEDIATVLPKLAADRERYSTQALWAYRRLGGLEAYRPLAKALEQLW